MATVLLLLAMHPEHQEKVYQEIKQFMPTRDSDLTAEHLGQLKFTRQCIMEALRLMPTVPLMGRSPTRPIKLSNGVIVPAGVPLILAVRQTQTRTEYWGHDAKQFNPDRYERPECQSASQRPGTFLGFSHGLRNCIGTLHLVCVCISHSHRWFLSFCPIVFDGQSKYIVRSACSPRARVCVLVAICSQTIWFRCHYKQNCFDFALRQQILFCELFTDLAFSVFCVRFAGYHYAMATTKMVIAHTIRHYRLTTPLRLDELKMKQSITYRLLNKHLIQIHAREWGTANVCNGSWGIPLDERLFWPNYGSNQTHSTTQHIDFNFNKNQTLS